MAGEPNGLPTELHPRLRPRVYRPLYPVVFVPDRPRRSIVPAVAVVLTTALVGLLGYGMLAGGTDATLDDAVKRGERPVAPGATMSRPLLNGRGSSTSLGGTRGQVVVLNFWAHWCEPCGDEAPVLNRAQRRLVRERLGTVLGATYDDPPVDARAFQRKYKLEFPSVSDVGTKLAREFGTNKLPETFVIDRRGRVVAISRGQISWKFLDGAITEAAR